MDDNAADFSINMSSSPQNSNIVEDAEENPQGDSDSEQDELENNVDDSKNPPDASSDCQRDN